MLLQRLIVFLMPKCYLGRLGSQPSHGLLDPMWIRSLLVRTESAKWDHHLVISRLSKRFETFNIPFEPNFLNSKNIWFEHIQTVNFSIWFASLQTSNISNISNIFRQRNKFLISKEVQHFVHSIFFLNNVAYRISSYSFRPWIVSSLE
jgi:hypothetical protein